MKKIKGLKYLVIVAFCLSMPLGRAVQCMEHKENEARAQELSQGELRLKTQKEIISKFSQFLQSSAGIDQESLRVINALAMNQGAISLLELNNLAQKFFLRPKGAERLSPGAIAHYRALCAYLTLEEQEEIIRLFRKIGDIDAVYPSREELMPDGILIQGSTVPNMRERIMLLAEVIENGQLEVQESTQVLFFTGERALFPEETKEVLLDTSPYKANKEWNIQDEDLPVDERQAAKMVWQQLELPLALKQIKLLFIESEKKEGEARAQTEDGALSWLKQGKVREGLYIIISSNPFVYYQQRVIELKFRQAGYKNGFTFKGIGREAPLKDYPKEIAIGVLMDNLARTLYVEKAFLDLN